MEVHVMHHFPWTEVNDGVSWPFSDDAFQPKIGQELFQNYIDELVHCEEVGFDAAVVNEHHYSAFGLMPSPNLIAAILASRTDTIKIGVYGNVLPLRGHPIRVAEEVAMLDNLSEGRFISGFVRGIPPEYAAYGIDPQESRSRFKEAWELIVKAWTADEPFDWDGEHWKYDDVYIWPRPVQDPHPPLWMPAASEKSLQFAAEKRVPIAGTLATPEELAEAFERYREIAEEDLNWSPTTEHFGVSRSIYVGETMEQAKEEYEEHIEYFYDKLLGGALRATAVNEIYDHPDYQEDVVYEHEDKIEEKAKEIAPGNQGEKALEFDFDELNESGEIIVGDPEHVVEEIERQYEVTGGFNRLIARFQEGSLPHKKVIKNQELFADEVYPHIKNL